MEKFQSFKNESEIGLIKFISNKENEGFAHANNVALRKTSAKYVLLLNSDTIVVDNCLEKSLEYMEIHQDV
ncbi:MAG: glycosyltransferase, partial [Methanobacterium sp.]